MGKKWKVLPNCTFRSEDDGAGFVFNADNDALHPVNKMATQLLRELSDGPATEQEIFERMWPHLEASIRDSVREDFRVFLRALSERGCLGTEGEEQEKDMVEAKSDIYSPPLVEEFGRRRRREIDPDEEPKSNDDKMQRRRFFAVGAGALAAMAAFPRKASAAGNCDPSGHAPDPNWACYNGIEPQGDTGYCQTGDSPDPAFCNTGNYPGGVEKGTCTDLGNHPWFEHCNAGSVPAHSDCHNGTSPALECNTQGNDPTTGACIDFGMYPNNSDPDADCYQGNEPNDTCFDTGSMPYAEGYTCQAGYRPT